MEHAERSLERAATILRECDDLLIAAGAGMGVDSGLPDFRGNKGFWQAYPPYQRLGIGFERMANPDWFEEDPALGWGFYGHRLRLYRDTEPHAGFAILRSWVDRMRSHFVLTSNVDGHFQRSGFERVCEIHGSIRHLQCTAACDSSVWSADDVNVAVDTASMQAREPLPRCGKCGKVARPNILMFDDYRFQRSRTAAAERRYEAWLRGLPGVRIAIVEIGAGTALPSIRSKCEHHVRQRDARLIRINPTAPEVPPGQVGLAMGGLEALQRLDNLIKRH